MGSPNVLRDVSQRSPPVIASYRELSEGVGGYLRTLFPTQRWPVTRLEENNRTVTAFYDLMFNQAQAAEAVRRYVGDRYIQHNPMVADGPEAFIAYFGRMAKEHPGYYT